MSLKVAPYDSADLLDSESLIAEYAEEMLNESDPVLIRHAVAVVARAHGFLRLADTTGLPRDAIIDAMNEEIPGDLGLLRAALSATSQRRGQAAA